MKSDFYPVKTLALLNGLERKTVSPSSPAVLLGLLKKIHDEIDAIDEGIPMSGETWDELCDTVGANAPDHAPKGRVEPVVGTMKGE